MALSVYAGSFTHRSGTGTQAITGVGFQPKAVLFWSGLTGATGFDSGGTRFSVGWSDGTNHRGVSHTSLDNTTPTNTGRTWRTTKCLVFSTETATVQAEAHVQSLDSDGFTLNWTTNSVATRHIHYLAIGGSTVSAAVGDFTSSASTGNQSITGLAFTPTLVLFLNAAWTTGTISDDATTFGPIGLGWYGGADGQAFVSTGMVDNTSPSDTGRYQSAAACVGRINATNSGLQHVASGVSLDASGFTLNWSTAAAGKIAYLALSGVRGVTGAITQPTSTGTQTTTIGTHPSAVLFGSVNAVASASVLNNALRLSLGATDGTRQRSYATGEMDNVSPTVGFRYIDNADLLTLVETVHATGASTSAAARATLGTLNSDGFTLNWTIADATAREILYLAFASLVVVTTDPATDMTSTEATLHGHVNPKGAATNGWFRWGTTNPPTAFDTTPQALGSGTSVVAYEADLTGLDPGETYYFRAVGNDGSGDVLGAVLSFTTTAAVNHGFLRDAGPSAPLEILYLSTSAPLYVFLSWWVASAGFDNTDAVAGITFDGAALTRGGHKAVAGNTMEWWRLDAPAAGTAPLVVSMAATRNVSIGVLNLTGWPSAIADHRFEATGNIGSAVTPFLRMPSTDGTPIVQWLGFNSQTQDLTVDAGSTEVWNEEGLGTTPLPATGDQLSAGATTVGLAISTPLSWGITDFAEAWGLAGLTYIPDDADELQKVTQQVLLVGVDEDHEPPVPDTPCVGGGDVADGTNPAAGPDLSTATVPIAWVELELVDGTRLRYAKATIPHGTPKFGRVLRFGRVVRRLTDGDGGPQASIVTTHLADTDRALRAAAWAGTLNFALVEYFVADLETIRAGGTPHRVFRGRVQDWTADVNLTLTITVQDELSARLTSANAIDTQSPIRAIDRTMHDFQPRAPLMGKAAPEVYGSLADTDGTCELRHIQDVTIDPGPLAELGQLSMFLVCSGAVGRLQSVYAADPLEDPPVSRRQVPESAFGNWIFAPHHSGWMDAAAPYWEDADGRRWTVVLGVASHPAIVLAVEGRIPIVCNLCGYEDFGDGTGETLERPARAFLHWLNNRVVQDTPDDWRPIFSLDDYSLFDTTTFDDVDAICETRGYRVAGVLGHDYAFQSWRDRVAEWCRNFGFEVGTNRHGQVVLVILDRDGSPPTAATLTPATILEGGCQVTMRNDAVENIVPYVYARNYVSAIQRLNPEPQARGLRDPVETGWVSDRLELVDEASVTALGGHPRGERPARVQEYTLVRDETTAERVATERLELRAVPNGRAEVTFDLVLRDGWALELGALVSVEHWDVPWAGPRRCQIRGVELDVDALTLTITVRDVEDLLTGVMFGMSVSARLDIATMDVMRLGNHGTSSPATRARLQARRRYTLARRRYAHRSNRIQRLAGRRRDRRDRHRPQ